MARGTTGLPAKKKSGLLPPRASKTRFFSGIANPERLNGRDADGGDP